MTEEQIKSYYTSPKEEDEKVKDEVKTEEIKDEVKTEEMIKDEVKEEKTMKEEELVADSKEKEKEDGEEKMEGGDVQKEDVNGESLPTEDEIIQRVVKSAVFRAKESERVIEEEKIKEQDKSDIPKNTKSDWNLNAINTGLRERGNNTLPFVPIYVPVVVPIVVKEKEKKEDAINPRPGKLQQVLGALVPLITTLIYFFVFFWRNLVV